MAHIKYLFLFSIFFTQCFGMQKEPLPYFEYGLEIIPQLNTTVAVILGHLRKKDIEQTLQAKDFWELVQTPIKSVNSYFLTEAITRASEEDVCLILKYLIQFGKQDLNSFSRCLAECKLSEDDLKQTIQQRIDPDHSCQKIRKLYLELSFFLIDKATPSC